MSGAINKKRDQCLERACDIVRNLSYATGHADNIEQLIKEVVWQAEERGALRTISFVEGWQPIETAPRDGRFVMLHIPQQLDHDADVTLGWYEKNGERGTDGKFQGGRWIGIDSDTGPSCFDPVAWMPLPAPPSDEN